MKSITTFNRAILRHPAQTAINGLRAVDRGAPDITGLMREHKAYRTILEDLGVVTTVLPAIETFPDSVFVEDPALVFKEGAIALNPGAPSRQGETSALQPTLKKLFKTVIELDEGFAEGGDVLITPERVIIGLSQRTDRQGAEALVHALKCFGKQAVIVTPPPGVLHFKTACSMVADDTVLATRTLLEGGDYFEGLKTLPIPDGEEAAANALCINGTVLLADGFQKTAQMLEKAGMIVKLIKVQEVMKLDAGLSCMSLRWNET